MQVWIDVSPFASEYKGVMPYGPYSSEEDAHQELVKKGWKQFGQFPHLYLKVEDGVVILTAGIYRCPRNLRDPSKLP